MNREEMIRSLFAEASDRVLKGEDPDPCTAICGALLRKEAVTDFELEVVLAAHVGGPWQVNTMKKLEVFSRWCDACGSPLGVSKETEVVNNQMVYRNDFGDCWAVWTRKGRLHIGFADEGDAKQFRASDRRFSMEETGNKRMSLVVVEGGDTPETIKQATRLLMRLLFPGYEYEDERLFDRF